MEFSIRRAVQKDAAALSWLGAATVLETYHALVPGADLLTFCNDRHNPAVYAAWLDDPACAVWIAEAPMGAPVGYLVLIPASLPMEEPSGDDLEVLRIYVLHPFHKAGLGHRLIRLAIDTAMARRAARLVLGVNDENARALAFYRRQGFEVIGKRDFVVGNTVCADSVLGLDLAAR